MIGVARKPANSETAVEASLPLEASVFSMWRASRVTISMGCVANGAPIWAVSRLLISSVGC